MLSKFFWISRTCSCIHSSSLPNLARDSARFTDSKQVKSGRQPHGLPNFANPPNRMWYIPDLAQWSGMSYWLAEPTSSPIAAATLCRFRCDEASSRSSGAIDYRKSNSRGCHVEPCLVRWLRQGCQTLRGGSSCGRVGSVSVTGCCLPGSFVFTASVAGSSSGPEGFQGL